MNSPRTTGTGRWLAIIGAGVLAGLVAALVMTLVMLLLRAILGISPPIESIPDRFAPTLSIETFFGMIGRFGGYNELKQFGVGSVLAGQLVVGMLLGLLYAVVVERDRAGDRTGRARLSRRGLVLLAALLAAAWAVSLGVLWPVLGSNFRGLPPGAATIATGPGLLVAYASYGLALVVTYRWMAPGVGSAGGDARPTGGKARPTSPASGRRAVLAGGLGLALALATGGLLRRLWDQASFSYDGMRYTDPDIQGITPNDRFYVVTKNVIDPSVVRAAWRFEVAGLVDRPRSYRFEELAGLPATTQETTLMCISNGVGDGLMSNAAWKGVPLRELLGAAGPRSGAVEVLLRGADGYTDTFALDKALDPTTLVVYEMNGEPLSERHGYPARVIVPGLFGEKNVKWVTRVELVDHDAKGFYEQQGWGPNFVIPIRSRFYAPDFNQPLRLGAPIELRGIVFGGDRGISRAEVSVDDGQTWYEARLEYPGTPLSWAIWSYQWQPTQPGEYRLAVRGTDAAGTPQIAEERGIVPEGATGYHRVTARIAA